MVIKSNGCLVTINTVNITADVPQSEVDRFAKQLQDERHDMFMVNHGPAMDERIAIMLYNNAGTVTVPAYRPSPYAQLCDLWNQQGIKVGEA